MASVERATGSRIHQTIGALKGRKILPPHSQALPETLAPLRGAPNTIARGIRWRRANALATGYLLALLPTATISPQVSSRTSSQISDGKNWLAEAWPASSLAANARIELEVRNGFCFNLRSPVSQTEGQSMSPLFHSGLNGARQSVVVSPACSWELNCCPPQERHSEWLCRNPAGVILSEAKDLVPRRSRLTRVSLPAHETRSFVASLLRMTWPAPAQQMQVSLSQLRFASWRLALLASLLAVFLSGGELTAAEPPRCVLAVSSASVIAGTPVELSVRLDSPSTQVAAVSFVIDYDNTRLTLARSEAAPGAVSPLDVTVPPTFVSSIFEFPERGQIGISIYDPSSPIDSLPSGTLLKIRFETRVGASGFAPVRVAVDPQPDASDARGEKVPVSVSTTHAGIKIDAPNPVLNIQPHAVEFGTTPVDEVSNATIIISNFGTDAAFIASIEVGDAGDSQSPFSIINPPTLPYTLGRESSLPITIAYHPPEPGRHEQSLRIMTAGGAVSEIVIRLSGNSPPEGVLELPIRKLIPSVASVPGANGSHWTSSLVAHNSGSRSATLRFALQRPGRLPLLNATVTIPSGRSLRWSDVVSELFGESESAGFLTVELSSPEVALESATSNILDGGGLVSQSVPVLAWAEVFRSGQTARLIGLNRSTDSRTNIALMNLGKTTVMIHARVLDEAGALAGEREYLLEPGDIIHGIDLFNALSIDAAENLTVEFRCTSEDGVFFAHASTIDQRTGAPVFQAAQ